MAFRIPASYILLIGVTHAVLPFLLRQYPEFEASSSAFQVGARTRELIFAVAFIVAGVGLFWHHSWAGKLALVFLVIATPYDANGFAWGFAGGQPTRRVKRFSMLTVAVWNGLWFYLVYRVAL